jgi:hypothetical protein
MASNPQLREALSSEAEPEKVHELLTTAEHT